ncbi:hypothetical protein [Burkholderia phage FLC9]|nr:hypothetical protein [Burkholderia phage FLC9]
MDMIFDLADVQKVTRQHIDDFDSVSGFTDDSQPFCHLTNFRAHMVPVYLTAIQQSGLDPKDFAIADQAMGFNACTGAKWDLDDDHRGFFYRCNNDDLQKFHQAYANVLKAHPTFKH